MLQVNIHNDCLQTQWKLAIDVHWNILCIKKILAKIYKEMAIYWIKREILKYKTRNSFPAGQ